MSSSLMFSPKGNSLAMERMREKDEQDRLSRMSTKQKRGTPIRDIGLQQKVLNWMMDILEEKPKGKTDYDHWLQDGTVLVKVLQTVMFNSVPLEMVMPMQGLNTREERVKILLKYLRRYGVPEEYLFTERDLFEFKNIPKVTRCFAMLGKMANISHFSDLSLEIPNEDVIYIGDSDDEES